MLIKMSVRSGARNLSKHLLNTTDNEQAILIELRDFTADNLHDALNETHSQRLANKNIKKEFVSMSINPPIGEAVSIEALMDAANHAEAVLSLSNQPRAIVEHSKNGRNHIHVVWSRIDENLKAIKLPFYKTKLQDLSKQLYLENGWELPKGMRNKQERSQTNFDLAEAHIAKRQKRDPKTIKSKVQEIWNNARDANALIKRLREEQFVLARGDNKRAVVLVDIHGDIRALTRTANIKAKEVKTKISPDMNLPSVQEAKAAFLPEHKKQYEAQQAHIIRRQSDQLTPHAKAIDTLIARHKQERDTLEAFHKDRQDKERAARQSVYTSKLSALWAFVTGKYIKQKRQHQAEYETGLQRDKQEREALRQIQSKAREKLQQPLDALKKQHQAELAFFHSRFMDTMQSLGIEETFTHALQRERQHTKTPSHLHHHELGL